MKCSVCNSTLYISSKRGTTNYKGRLFLESIYCPKCFIKFELICIPPFYFIEGKPYWKRKTKWNTCQTCLKYYANKRGCKQGNNKSPEDFCSQYELNNKLIYRIKEKTAKTKMVICPSCGGAGYWESWDSSSRQGHSGQCSVCKGAKKIKVYISNKGDFK